MIEKPFLRTAFNYDRNVVSDEVSVQEFGPSLTDESQSAETDINMIAKRFGVTGMMPQVTHPPMYDDFTGVSDFQTAMNAINLAREEFMKLSAHTRARFANNEQMFLEFASNPDNIGEMDKLGLASDSYRARVKALADARANGERDGREKMESGYRFDGGDDDARGVRRVPSVDKPRHKQGAQSRGGDDAEG